MGGGGSRGGVVAVRGWHTFAGKTPSAIFWLKGESFLPLCELKRLPISGWVSEPVVVVVVGVQAENFDCKAT